MFSVNVMFLAAAGLLCFLHWKARNVRNSRCKKYAETSHASYEV